MTEEETDEETDEEAPTNNYGITEKDLEQIAAFLKKPPYERSPDDLCSSSER